jgi:hypothetical protein
MMGSSSYCRRWHYCDLHCSIGLVALGGAIVGMRFPIIAAFALVTVLIHRGALHVLDWIQKGPA